MPVNKKYACSYVDKWGRWQGNRRAYLELCHVKFGSQRNLISVCIQPGSSGYSDDQIPGRQMK